MEVVEGINLMELTQALPCVLQNLQELENKELWWDARVFRAEEQRRAEINKLGSFQRKVFISHCWRKTLGQDAADDAADPQRKKRQMISHLSIPLKVMYCLSSAPCWH